VLQKSTIDNITFKTRVKHRNLCHLRYKVCFAD